MKENRSFNDNCPDRIDVAFIPVFHPVIEPVYEFEFVRRDRAWVSTQCIILFLRNGKKPHPEDPKPDYFVFGKMTLTPEEHIKVQAAAQDYVTHRFQKTVAPKTHTVEDVEKTLYFGL